MPGQGAAKLVAVLRRAGVLHGWVDAPLGQDFQSCGEWALRLGSGSGRRAYHGSTKGEFWGKQPPLGCGTIMFKGLPCSRIGKNPLTCGVWGCRCACRLGGVTPGRCFFVVTKYSSSFWTFSGIKFQNPKNTSAGGRNDIKAAFKCRNLGLSYPGSLRNVYLAQPPGECIPVWLASQG